MIIEEGDRIRFYIARPRWWRMLLIVPLIRWLIIKRKRGGTYYVTSVTSTTVKIGHNP